MFSKLWFLIYAIELVIVNGVLAYVPAYSGIKTTPYHHESQNPDFPNQQLPPQRGAYINSQQHRPSSGYENTNYDATSSGLSPTSNQQRYDATHTQRQHSHKPQQQHQNTQPADVYQQRELPLYNRDSHVRQSAPPQYRESIGNGVEQTDYHTGCPPQHTGPVAYAYDCRRFVNCWHGRGHIQSCGPGTVFNPDTLECDRPDKVVCGTLNNMGTLNGHNEEQALLQPIRSGPSNYRAGRVLDDSADGEQSLCPQGVSGLIPHPSDCTKFLSCANGKTFVKNCGEGTAFSIATRICDFREKVDCTGRVAAEYDTLYNRNDRQFVGQSHTDTNHKENAQKEQEGDLFCPPGITDLFPYPFDYTKFINCKQGNTAIQNCMPGTMYSISRSYCDLKENMNSNDHVVYVISDVGYEYSQTIVSCPPFADGVHLYPYDFNKYITCREGRMQISICTPNTVFSISKKTCRPESQVNVNDRVRTPTDQKYDFSTHTQSAGIADNHGRPMLEHHNWMQRQKEPSNPTHNTAYEVQINHHELPAQPSRANTYGDRWSNMDIQRPLATVTTYNADQDRQQRLPTYGKELHHTATTSWVGRDSTSEILTQNNIYEEGSLEPNRNYNTAKNYKVPLAPFSPHTVTDATRTAHPYTNDSMHLYFAQPLGTDENSEEAFDSDTLAQPTVNWPTIQSGHNQELPSSQWIPIPNQVLMPPLRTHEQTNSNNNNGNVHTQSTSKNDHGPIDPFTPLNPQLSEQNFHSNYDSSNLYGGLQPPVPPPAKALENKTPLVTTYEPYTPIYTTTPATYLQPPTLPTPSTTSRTNFTGSTRLHKVHPLIKNSTVAMFSKDPHYSHPYSNVAHAGSAKSNEFQDQQISKTLMGDALRLLLRPYFNLSDTITGENAEVATSHIMQLAPQLPENLDTTISIDANQNSDKIEENSNIDAEIPADVELIVAGEQPSLIAIPVPDSTKKPWTEFDRQRTEIVSENSYNRHIHGHSRDFHRQHPNLPDPFTVDEHSGATSTAHTHHRHNHNREFHQRHPEIPNPFVPPRIHTDHGTTQNFDQTKPHVKSSTPISVQPEIDLRRADTGCQFDCGNGKCVKPFEVCNGVNNCGNRKDEEQCSHLGYEVRLTGGESANMGRIEIKILGKWGYVCDDKFGLRDADVVCRELGFKLGASEVRGHSHYPPTEVNVPFAMDEVECRGDEVSLKECSFRGWGTSNCGPDEVVGVVCKVPQLKCPNNYWLCSTSEECIPPAFVCDHTPDCSDKSDESADVCNSPVKYRLEGGRSPSEGRLEVRYHGEWGTVCDDDFGLKEAQVMCNFLGFYGKPTIEKNTYGPGSGPIWLDQVSCFGNETSIDQCNHWTWGEHNCNHTEDVGLRCKTGTPPQKSYSPQKDVKWVKDDNVQQEIESDQQQFEEIGLYSGQWERRSKAVVEQRRCGQFKNNLVDEYAYPEERVVNGTLAKRGHHPWQATIRTRGRGGISSHWCGAVLISSRHLLTAAHCLSGYPKGAYLVRLGDHYANIAEASEIDSFIENWYVHEKFRDSTHMNNDIALIVLKTPVKFNDYIQPVCLPDKDAPITENRTCTISGWGSIKSGVSTPSNILRAATLPILPDEICKQPYVYGAALTEGMFCAGYMDESVDACDGDSGGPLICHDEGGETLYGIISWGQHCGYANRPGVYVRVEKYLDWIFDKINYSLQKTFHP